MEDIEENNVITHKLKKLMNSDESRNDTDNLSGSEEDNFNYNRDEEDVSIRLGKSDNEKSSDNKNITTENKYTKENLNKKNIKELKVICKELRIKKYYKLIKNDIIKKILNHNKKKNNLTLKNEKKELNEDTSILKIYEKSLYDYKRSGSRSQKKVDTFHNGIINILKIIFNLPIYKIVTEKYVPSENRTGKKKCDIIILKNNKPYIIFPTKLPITSINKNLNNYYENLTGELTHLKWENDAIKIIPINIFMNKSPNIIKNNIKNFENVNYETYLKHYNNLIKHQIAYDCVNYIIDVEHDCKINEKFNKMPKIIGFNKNTPYRKFKDILKLLI